MMAMVGWVIRTCGARALRERLYIFFLYIHHIPLDIYDRPTVFVPPLFCAVYMLVRTRIKDARLKY